jgi:hypothetical protein
MRERPRRGGCADATSIARLMMAEDQLAYESRVRVRQAAVAGIAGALLLGAAAAQLAGPQPKAQEQTLQLIFVNKRFPLDIIGSVLQAVGLLALVWTLSFLFDAARARKPEMAPATRIAMLLGGVISAIGGIVYGVVIAVKAHQFVHSGSQTWDQFNHVAKGAALPTLQTLDIAAQFALAVSIVLISLNAMRVGLLTRFMGYFGIVVGAAGMLLIGSPPAAVLEIGWVLALGYLFSGRWPQGDPPAWRTGKAEPWPSAVEQREARMREGGARGGGRDGRDGRGQEQDVTPAATASGRTRATTPKRKRKTRR